MLQTRSQSLRTISIKHVGGCFEAGQGPTFVPTQMYMPRTSKAKVDGFDHHFYGFDAELNVHLCCYCSSD